MEIRTDDKIYTALSMIRELYNVNVSIITSPNIIKTFEKNYHFHKAQNALTENNIKEIINEHPDETVFLTDSFTINYIIFRIKKVPIIIGPFCTLMLSSSHVRTIFNKYKINDISVNDFLSYYDSLPVFSETQAIHMVEAIHSVNSISAIPQLKKIVTTPKNYNDDSYTEIKRKNNLKLLQQRYLYEQNFMLAIEKGSTRSAILNLHNMQSDVSHLKRLGTTLENEKIGAAITRTTVRLAAMRAHLPIYLIDQLSRNNTIAIFNAKNVDEILQAKENMIREFCSAIQRNKNSNYSALIQSLLYYFEHNYFDELSLDEISNELELSKNHIIAKFRKETGITPIAYLRKIRLRYASILLTGTNLSVQEISNSVGISDANYFVKLFKKEYGTSPLKYRKSYS